MVNYIGLNVSNVWVYYRDPIAILHCPLRSGPETLRAGAWECRPFWLLYHVSMCCHLKYLAMQPTALRIVILLNFDPEKTKHFNIGHGEFPYIEFFYFINKRIRWYACPLKSNLERVASTVTRACLQHNLRMMSGSTSDFCKINRILV
jgi:hypothetical protein